jgi:hypothetical protein
MASATTHTTDINYQAKKDLVEYVIELLETIETIKENEARMTDGNYLMMTNCLKKLYELPSKFQSSVALQVFRRQVRRGANRATRPKPPRNYEAQMKAGYLPCEFCGRLISPIDNAMNEHQSRNICRRIHLEKQGAIKSKMAIRSGNIENGFHILADWAEIHLSRQETMKEIETIDDVFIEASRQITQSEAYRRKYGIPFDAQLTM